MRSMKRPSRGLRESAITMWKNGRFFAPARAMRIFSVISGRCPPQTKMVIGSALKQSGDAVTHHPFLAEFVHLLHHPRHLHELLENLVHVGDVGARAHETGRNLVCRLLLEKK